MKKYFVYMETKTGKQLYICCFLDIAVLKVKIVH